MSDIVVISIITSLLLSLVLNVEIKDRKNGFSNGFIVCRINKVYKYVGWLGILFGLIVGLIAYFSIEDVNEAIIAGVSFLSLFSFIGVIVLLIYRNHILKFNESQFIITSFFGKKKEINWEELKEIKFSVNSNYIKFVSNSNEKVKIHKHLKMLELFADELEKQTKFSRSEMKIFN